MIDTTKEEVVTFTAAPRLLPRRRRNQRPALATIYRWSNEGVRGVRLEYICIGGTRCTSREALQRFFDRLTAQAQGEPDKAAAPSPDRQAAIARAESILAAAGI